MPKSKQPIVAAALLVSLQLIANGAASYAASVLPQQHSINSAPATSMELVASMNAQIQEVTQQIEQARRDRQQLLQEQKALNAAKPTAPPSGSPAAVNAQYQKSLSDWQAKANSLSQKLDTNAKLINSLETKLKSLQQKLQSVQPTVRRTVP